MSKRPLSGYPQPAVAVDLVVLSVHEDTMHTLLVRRDDEDETGDRWALPGGFVHIDQTFEEALMRVMTQKAGIVLSQLEQLGTYGALDRDPRGRVISVVYFALVPYEELNSAAINRDDLVLAKIDVPWEGEEGGAVTVHWPDREQLSLAFDHAEILGDTVKRLRGKLDYAPVAFALLDARFTLKQVHDIYQTILGKPLAKPAFRRKLVDRGWVRPTGTFEAGGAYRPAELYEINE
eukprot:s1_g56.t1